MGQKSAMACTIAVEELIGRQYNKQIEELFNDDPKANQELLRVKFYFTKNNFKFLRHYLNYATKKWNLKKRPLKMGVEKRHLIIC